ncbi:hypothetical protein SDC9_18878 [bioreactor metagenome]|uniref:Uncharacterized protein n=1 Tax=bioreactor metagenome TaxID=1076179 RepID=A0A644U1G2_9ZZZZ
MPVDRETRVEDGDGAGAAEDLRGPVRRGVGLFQRQHLAVHRQPVEGRAVARGEGLEVGKPALGLEDMREQRHRVRRGEAAGAAAGAFLGRVGMGRGIGAEEEARLARGRGLDQGKAMALALGDRQAIVMRLDPAHQDVVAVDDQVMRGDRRAEVFALAAHIVHTILGGDVLHHHPQPRGGAAHRVEHALDEHRLAVEDVDGRVGDLAMHAQRQADLGHRLEHAAHLVEVAHARGRVGGRPGRIELDRGDDARGRGGGDIGGVGLFGQVERHQRGEAHLGGQGRKDALAIGCGLRAGHHRRHQVRHDDRAGEMARALGQHGRQHRAVAQVQVPVVGAGERDLGHGFPTTPGAGPNPVAASRRCDAAGQGGDCRGARAGAAWRRLQADEERSDEDPFRPGRCPAGAGRL